MRAGPLRRIRGFWGHFALVAAVTAVASSLASGSPRLANHLTDAGLRHDLAAVPGDARDVTLTSTPRSLVGEVQPAGGPVLLERNRALLDEPLRGLIGEAWYSAHVGPTGVSAVGPRPPFTYQARPKVGLRVQTRVTGSARLTAGAWPATEPSSEVVEAAVSGTVAAALDLDVGSRFDFGRDRPDSPTIPVEIVGIFEPADPDAGVWSGMALALQPHYPTGDFDPYRAIAVTDDAGIVAADRVAGPATNTWRYRVDEGRLDASQLDALVTAIAAVRNRPLTDVSVATSLDLTLLRLAERLVAVRALVAVVQTGILATLLGLLLLAARLAVERRRDEFALLRARGGAARTVGARALTESVLVYPAAAVAGWVLGTIAPGRAGPTGWLVIAVAAVAVLAVPTLATLSQRRPTAVGARRDLVSHRRSVRRLTAEVSLLVLAGLGVLLLRRRGLDQDGGVDPYLVAVPLLLAVAVAVLALRAFPFPLRAVGRLAARSRGAVAFLGLSRAGRSAQTAVWPLAVLVVAITTGVFCAAVTTTIDDARDRATDADIAGDAVLTGYAFSPGAVRGLGQVPGVTAVATATVFAGAPLLRGGGAESRDLAPAVVAVVDARQWAAILERGGRPHGLPGDWVRAERTSGPVPALVSPAVSGDVGAGATADLAGRRYEFRTVAVTGTVAGLGSDLTRFVLLPREALPALDPTAMPPNRILVAGPSADPEALRAAGDAGQQAWLREELGRDVVRLPVPTAVTTWGEHRAGLDRTGANEVLTATFAGGAAGAMVLALLAVGFAVVAEAQARGRALSRLRTMGLSARQGRGLLLYELAPLVGTAVLAGGAVGLALPGLFAPALGLTTFTAGVAIRLRINPVVVGAMLGLVVAALAAAIVVEGMVNRRLRLGEVLRVGEET